jgi:hypothetical protein
MRTRVAIIVLIIVGATLVAGEPVGARPTRHYEGTYEGLHTFTLFTGGCLVDAQGGATFDVAPGPSWRFRTDYCGFIDGSTFTATGSFTFTLPGAATIVGTSSTEVSLPGGGPITLSITGGTMRFADASGTCTLQNQVREVTFGVLQQFGTFVCDITR